MKRFIIHGIFFIGFFALVMLPICAYNKAKVTNRVNVNQQLPEENIVLALGDSHVECSLNDQLFPEMVNRGKSSETYLYNLAKIEYYKTVNPVNVLLLSYNYFSLLPTRYNENGFSGDAFDYMCTTYFPLLIHQPENLKFLTDEYLNGRMVTHLLSNKFGFPSKEIFNEFFLAGIVKDESYDFVGGFRNEYVCKMDTADVITPYRRQYEDLNHLKFHSLLLKSLYRIGEYTQNNNIRLVLYNAPCHKDYNSLLQPKIKEGVDSLANEFCQKYNAIYLNYHDYPMPNDSCFRDYDHLNTRGAAIITPIVRDTLIKLGVIPDKATI